MGKSSELDSIRVFNAESDFSYSTHRNDKYLTCFSVAPLQGLARAWTTFLVKLGWITKSG